MSFINGCGSAKIGALQTKTANTMSIQQTIVPDSGYEALSNLTVNPPISQNINVSRNGTFTADEGYMCIDEVTVKVSKLSKNTNVILSSSSIKDTSTDSYHLIFTIPISEFGSVNRGMPYKILICSDQNTTLSETGYFDQSSGLAMAILTRDHGSVYSVITKTATNPPNYEYLKDGAIDLVECLTMDDNNYIFDLNLVITSDIFIIKPQPLKDDAFDVTFIWN